MTAKERRKEMIEILCQRRHETRTYFALRYGVSTRTIDNDISVLTFDYPIYTMTGPSGGIFIDEGYEIGKVYLPEKYITVLETMQARLRSEELEAVTYILKNYKKPKRRGN